MTSLTTSIRLPRSLARRLLALGAAVGLGLTLMPATPAAAAAPRIPATLFGMHDFNPVSWPAAPVGSVRLWDSGVTWRQLETAPGVFDFTLLDAQMDAAAANGARPLLVLGQTPRFHSSKPAQRGAYGLGAVAMPNLAAWKNYIATVVARYRGRGVDYQVWNEANVAAYWQGTPAQMATLTKIASTVINNNDGAAQVVAPALATRLTGQRAWLRSYYAQKLGAKKVSSFVDVVSLNLYPLARQSPEASMTLLAASRTMLRQAGVSKPIWNTEINYGLKGGGLAKRISVDKQAAYVARTFVLNAAAGMKRVYWYGWDVQRLANTQLSFPSASLTRAGTAYVVVRGWLVNTRAAGCSQDSRGTYTCTQRFAGGVKRIYWNPAGQGTVRAVASAKAQTGLLGVERPLSGGERIRVGAAPIMVRSAR